MSFRFLRPVALLTLVMLSACQRQNNVELTLVARSLNLETQIVALRASATTSAERLQVTVEYMATRAEVARRQRQELEATLVARGSPAPGEPGVPTGTPFPLPGTTFPPSDARSAAAAAPVAQNRPLLTDVVMAASVGADDCAAELRNEFTPASGRIYVVATAWNIRAGTRLGARFIITGQEVYFEFRPDSDIRGHCIWFFVDQSDLPFLAGTGSVRLEVDGQPASDAIPFIIRGA